MPSVIPGYSTRTKVIQLGFWILVLSEFVNAVRGYRTVVTFAGAVVGGTIIAGVVVVAVIDRFDLWPSLDVRF
ncbi:hypothetical protein SAMN04488063_1853 [Halopelagius inordinatus]|uniref:Uncharacterized protein n=1 Tax=Halopelagius inordinatus TaxID=553467 RepID=A0A1I2RAR0_9EURY|nr:hypothetical protein SAMN04488063_1853 [Halopelagius inordinatus]